MNTLNAIADDVRIGQNVRLAKFINLYGCEIGDESKIGAFVEIQKNAKVGKRCKISSHTFICEGVEIEDNVFIGHGVTFINDSYPRATTEAGGLQTESDWVVEKTLVRRGASIGSGATILSKVEIGENAIIGAGSVVTRDVPPNVIVAGNPAKILRPIPNRCGASDREPIPFLDLVTPHQELSSELEDVFRKSLKTAAFIGGEAVEGFEREFAEFCETQHSVAVNSGTDALRFALLACGIQPGDVVVTVSHTFIATVEAISQARAIPEFVDIDEHTYNMSPVMLRRFFEKQCTRDTSGRLMSLGHGRPVTAVVPVHLYGQMADMDAILKLAEEYGLTVVEDACQAHGASYYSSRHNRWFKAGSMGKAAAFSFYPGKNLGACGEGGAVTTNDPGIASHVRMLRDHGQTRKYHHAIEGYNGRLDSIQAGILRVKLPHLDRWNEQRRACADRYGSILANREGIQIPSEPSWSKAVYHLYVVRTSYRDGLMEHLKADGIGTGIHYPVPVHLQDAYSQLNYSKGDLPVTEQAAMEIVSLPMYPHLTEADQKRIAEVLLEFTQKSRVAV
jgi:dTDP-4-amino-4,6-dideoxygalactose transaminase/acetyltransferase-like isoleucine patch superfamily enzyme